MKTTIISKRWGRLFKRISVVVLVLIALISLSMMHPQFGKRPSKERLVRIKESVNYKNGKFQNINPTPQVTQPLTTALYDYLFNKSKDSKPNGAILAQHVEWDDLPREEPYIIWFGHSSYLLHVDGKNILVDPVFSGNASPIPGGGKAFQGTDVVIVEDLPAIDYLFISHDHYDHMDYKTLKALQPKVGKAIVGLGVGAHLEHWGYKDDQIVEEDWWNSVDLGDGFTAIVTPARHFSGRSIWSANTLWASYVLKSPSQTIYLGGDSGYDTHFKQIGDKYGPFDLAIMENGQYDLSWKYIHMMPEEVIQATKDLKAKVLLPVHSSKFVLANHAWYEPLERVSKEAEKQNQAIITPLIGEVVVWNHAVTTPTYWWNTL